MPDARAAGILLHLSSLPSPFGIGDPGPGARHFAEFLRRAGQTCWQMLPVHPVEAGQGYSPYSSVSSRAGNPLFISPELLVEQGLLEKADLSQYHLPQGSRVNYEAVEGMKAGMLRAAFLNFRKAPRSRRRAFKAFVEAESAAWLEDFALYTVLKTCHGGRPWMEWPEAYKKRDPGSLASFARTQRQEIEHVQWEQHTFFSQWKQLREFCAELGVRLIGDISFYVAHDSADVWRHPEIFHLDAEGNMLGVGGVPPDSFSEDGQMWGVPVYRWDALKARGWRWWLERLRKNREMFDISRLDHFRAFADYWEVPGGARTARQGEWLEGPGMEFFRAVRAELGELPFIAEDLGETHDIVVRLLEESGLPGMKLLQPAFGENMADSPHIPHRHPENCVVYPGTHDNNTAVGWFRQNATPETRRRLSRYCGVEAAAGNVHLLLARLAYGSVVRTVILPMQDVAGLDERAPMNTPGTARGNWRWRLSPKHLNRKNETLLRELSETFGRAAKAQA